MLWLDSKDSKGVGWVGGRGAATHRRMFCLDFFGMFRVLGECLFFGMLCFSFSECLDLKPTG